MSSAASLSAKNRRFKGKSCTPASPRSVRWLTSPPPVLYIVGVERGGKFAQRVSS